MKLFSKSTSKDKTSELRDNNDYITYNNNSNAHISRDIL